MSEMLTAKELHEILHEPKLAENVERMYEVGHVLCHESGFAVYGDSQTRQVSDLLLPEDIDQYGSSIDSPKLLRRSTSIDLHPLVRKQKTFDNLTDDEINQTDMDELEKLLEESEAHELSEKARLAIEKISADTNLEGFEKEDLIRSVKEKDRRNINGITDTNIRDDILLLAHNHPRMPHLVDIHIDHLIKPSPADLNMHDFITTESKSMVDLIVATTGKVNKAIMLGTAISGQTNLQLYEAKINQSMSLPRVLG